MKNEKQLHLSLWQKLFLFGFPLLGMSIILSLFLITELSNVTSPSEGIGGTILRFRYVFMGIIVLVGTTHLAALFRWAVLPMARAEQSESQMRVLLDTLPDTVLLIDRQRRYRHVKLSEDVPWPFTASEVLGKRMDEVMPKETGEHAMSTLRDVLNSDESHTFEYERPLNGKTYYFESNNRRYGEDHVVVVLRNITERRRAEKQIRYQASLVENIQDAVISTDIEFRILSWNHAAERMYGWSAEEAIGKYIDDILPCHWSAAAEAASKKALVEEGYWRGEVRQPHKDGRLLDILGSTNLTRNEEGEITGAVSINRNITELKQAESALRESKVRNSALVDVIPDAMAHVDRDGTVLDAKLPPHWIDLSEGRDIVGKKLLDLAPSEQMQQMLDKVQQVIEDGEMRETEYEFSTDWGMLYVETRMVKSGPDEVLIIARDVTERRQYEEQLRYQAKLLTSMSDAVFSVDNDFRIISWNRAAELMYGWREEEVVGKVFTDITRPNIIGDTMEEFQTHLYEHGTWQGQVEKVRRDGHRVDTLSSCDVIYDNKGEPLGVLVVSRDITKQKQAERALRESEARNSALIGVIPDSLARVSYDGVCLDVKLGEEFGGQQQRDRFLGKNLIDTLPPDVASLALKTIRRVIDSGESEEVEYEMGPDDQQIVIEARHVKSGEREAFVIARDVTERRQNEDGLRFQATLLGSVFDAVVFTDMDFRVVSMNAGAEALYGWREEEIMGKLFREVVHIRMLNATRDEAIDELMRESNWRGEQLQRRKDGREITISASISVVYDADGNPIGTLGVNRDITERKEAELALQESEVRFRSMVEHAGEAIVLYDMDNRELIEVNDYALKLFGRTREEIADANREPLSSPIQPGGLTLEEWRAEMRRILERDGQMTHEMLLRHGDGHDILCESRVVTLPDSQRWLVRMSLIDITKRRQRQERMQQSQKLESLGLLAGGIAHDFNNLLTGIMGQTSLAMHKLSPDHPAYVNIERATAAGQRVRTLIQQMLAYAGRGQVDVETIELNQIIRESTQLLDSSLPSNVTLEERLDETLPPVEADGAQLQQVVVNLILNAVDAICALDPHLEDSPAARQYESGQIIVETGTRLLAEFEADLFLSDVPLAPGRYITLRIQDNGVGMTPTTLMRVFDPFYSTKSTGTGLGLSVAMGIIKRHGGGLNVISQLNRGTVFEVLLPIVNPVQSSAQAQPAAQSTSKGTVLIVDDNEMLRQTARDILESAGLDVLTAHNGYAGINRLHERGTEIDLVLLDMRMPGLDGAQTFERLRELNPQIKVIVSSGYSSSEQEAHLRDAEDVRFIPKPYVASELIEIVQHALNDEQPVSPLTYTHGR